MFVAHLFAVQTTQAKKLQGAYNGSKLRMEKNDRGRFRRFEMKELEQWAGDLRFDDKRSKLQLVYPLQIKASVARKEGLRLAIGNPPDETYRLGPFVCAKSPQSHIGPFKHAIDFLVPDGTPVLAACDGEVFEFEDSWDTYGNGPEYRHLVNYLTIRHENGEYTQYCHLTRGSAAHYLFGFSQVKQGQQIATVGKTGWTDRDHLHFVVFRYGVSVGPFRFKSLKPTFKRKWWPW